MIILTHHSVLEMIINIVKVPLCPYFVTVKFIQEQGAMIKHATVSLAISSI